MNFQTRRTGLVDATRACRIVQHPGVSDLRREADAVADASPYRGDMGDEQMSGHEVRQRMSWGIGIALGMGVGVAMGSALDNMGAGIAIGVAIGIVFAVAFGAAGSRRRAADDGGDADAEEPDDDQTGDDEPDSAR